MAEPPRPSRVAGLSGRDLAAYVPAQVIGGIAGAMLANLMFDLPAVSWSSTTRSGGHLWLAEVVASAGLVLLVFALVRSGRTGYAPAAVGAYIGAAYWFTSSTSFANPAVTVGRMFTDTFAGISPSSVPGYVLAQLGGLLVGLGLVVLFYPHRTVRASGVAAALPPLPDRLPAAYPDLDLGADLGGSFAGPPGTGSQVGKGGPDEPRFRCRAAAPSAAGGGAPSVGAEGRPGAAGSRRSSSPTGR